jgi:hypothetical protein
MSRRPALDRALASPDIESVSAARLADALGVSVRTVQKARGELGITGRTGSTRLDDVREALAIATRREDGAVKLSDIVHGVRAARPELDRSKICGLVKRLVGLGELERVDAGWYRPVSGPQPKQEENIGRREAGMRRKDGTTTGWASPDASLSTHKAPDSVIRVNREMGESRQDHPAVFPVGFPAHIIEAYSSRGDLVLEPFAGSGTTLIACAETGRVARCIELDPTYCDVIRRRWTRYAKERGLDPGTGALDG